MQKKARKPRRMSPLRDEKRFVYRKFPPAIMILHEKKRVLYAH
jgi:hypothetical protein